MGCRCRAWGSSVWAVEAPQTPAPRGRTRSRARPLGRVARRMGSSFVSTGCCWIVEGKGRERLEALARGFGFEGRGFVVVKLQ